ncbi:MAG: MFS transporter [Saprospiraceae bacterium]|nr:MFS transporter [Saprospiraceae bacterium]
MKEFQKDRKLWILIIVASLGYFVDIFDLILFNVVKYKSFQALGFSAEKINEYEISLFNYQMSGMLIGGLFWGILGDKRGRISVLFGSILLYSIANIANAFVQSFEAYAVWRFIAGLGLAGELGAGITLVTETMQKDKRGIGTMIIVTFGALGAVVASIVGKYFEWNIAYIIGGVLGLLLLLLRAGTIESKMFEIAKTTDVKRGNFFMLFHTKERFIKFMSCIFIGFPVWFFIGVLVALSKYFFSFEGVSVQEQVSQGVTYSYIGLSIGDLICGLASQYFKNRKKVIFSYLFISLILMFVYLTSTGISFSTFKIMSLLLGIATGYWALFVTNAAEQFGTNLRSTVTNTVPNFVRGAVVPITYSFKYFVGVFVGSQIVLPAEGAIKAAMIVGTFCIGIAMLSLLTIDETFSKDLDYHEV